MRAAVLVESRKPLVLADLDMPALGVGQVHVRIQYAAICGAQLGEIEAKKGPDKFLPHLLGHEGVGQVVAVGAGVKAVAVGDTVILHWRPSDGIQSDPPVYTWNGQRVNAGWVTTFQDEAIVSENRLTKLPEGIALKDAPLFGCAWTTAYGVVTHDAHVKPGDSVLVIGAGGVGLPIIQMAKLAGAWPIRAVEPMESKTNAALNAGATSVWTSSDGLPLQDVVIDTTGRADCIQRAYELTKPQGRCILVGVPHHDDPITIDSLPLHFGKVLTGSQGGECQPHRDIPRLANLVRAGKLNLDGHVTHEFPLDKINVALDLVRSGEAGRVLLRMAA